jgi:hypothetical protein
MLHPDTQLRYLNAEVGYGVFATAAIPRGTIVWVRDCLDQEFTREQLSQLPAVYQAPRAPLYLPHCRGNQSAVLGWRPPHES